MREIRGVAGDIVGGDLVTVWDNVESISVPRIVTSAERIATLPGSATAEGPYTRWMILIEFVHMPSRKDRYVLDLGEKVTFTFP